MRLRPGRLTFIGSAGSKPIYSLAKEIILRAFFLLSVLALPAAELLATILPPDRTIVWEPGVEGGIPHRTQVFADVTQPPYNAPNDGSADAAPAIQDAIDDCPAGRVVFIPAGTYRLDGRLEIRKGITLRGAGPAATILQLQLDSDIYIGGNWTNSGAVTQITSGYGKGSDTIVVADPAAFSVGEYVFVDQLNDPSFVDDGGCTWNGRGSNSRALRQLVKITGRSGDTLTIDPALYYGFSPAFVPELIELSTWVVEWAGIEDLKLDRVAAPVGQGRNIEMTSCANCWISNVESDMVYGRHFWLNRCAHCEVRDSFVHHAFDYCSGGIAYGIVIADGTSDTLVENNVARYLNNPISNESLGAGNVVAYNYTDEAWNCDEPDTDWLMADFNLNHCAHNYMTLVEGNQSSQISADAFHGSSSHLVLLRNHADAQHPTPRSSHLISVDLHFLNRYVSAVGNVLGQPGLLGVYELNGVSCSNQPAAYKLGYNNDGDCDPTGNDPQVAGTLLRHGNFEYFTGSTVWDPTISDHDLPNSYYLTSKPSFFGDLRWPAFGSDLSPRIGSLPAKHCFEQELMPNCLEGGLFSDGFESGGLSAWSLAVP